MPAVLNITNLSKSYGYHQVLNNVSFHVNDGERLGLVGANGVGKSTLLTIILGKTEADSGTVLLAAGRTLGYLAQVMASGEDGQTLAQMIAGALDTILSLERQMRALEAQMASTDDLDAVMAAYGEVAERFEQAGGYDLDHRIDQVLAGLSVDHIARDRAFATLSGGEKTRVGLALLLLQSPDLLLLDEPTNHLDFASLRWLEAYLQTYRGAVLIVSHDREFLNRTVSAIIEIDEHSRSARRYTGNYDAYHATKTREREQWRQDWAREQEEIHALRLEVKEVARRNSNYRAHSDGDKFIRNFKIAQHDTTVSKRVRSAAERLNRLLENATPKPPKDLRFDYDFDTEALNSRSALEVDGLTKAFGTRVILDAVSFALAADSRVILVGPNGAGKSTLIRILAGVETADSGRVYRHPDACIGYLAQEDSGFDPALPAFTAYLDGLDGEENQLKARLIEMGLFHFDELDKRIGELSAGQQRKLQIARLIARRANLLLLDEPTNHISFDVLEGLEAALRDFPGAVIAATHDRRFMQKLTSGPRPAEIWEVREGTIIRHMDGYAGYLASAG